MLSLIFNSSLERSTFPHPDGIFKEAFQEKRRRTRRIGGKGETNRNNLLSVELCAVHLVPGLLGVVKVVEVNEGKASATSRMTVQHNLHPVQPTKPTNQTVSKLRNKNYRK